MGDLPPTELPEELHDRIRRACAEGDALAEAGDFAQAGQRYHEALRLIPEPKEHWNATTWVLAAIGDALFLRREYQYAVPALEDAMICPGGLGNPFLHLRLGQTMFELGELDRAADELMRAYMGGGPEAFAREDPKYLAFLSTRARLG